MKQINIIVDDKVHTRLGELARTAGMPLSTYARVLFEAAYAARYNSSGDLSLDAKVGAAVALYAAKKDSTAISRALGISEPVLLKIVDLWRKEVLA